MRREKANKRAATVVQIGDWSAGMLKGMAQIHWIGDIGGYNMKFSSVDGFE